MNKIKIYLITQGIKAGKLYNFLKTSLLLQKKKKKGTIKLYIYNTYKKNSFMSQ